MSQHHRAKGWDKGTSQRARAIITPQLPMPCVDCNQPVYPGQPWQVGHRIPISDPRGSNELWNLGPSHGKGAGSCNSKAGAKLGHQRTTEQKRDDGRMMPW